MKFSILIIILLCCFSVTAQKPLFHFTFEGIGDNREFHNGQSISQTILGALGTAEIGTTIENHSVFAGLTGLYEFGSAINFHKPWSVLYYRFETRGKEFLFGSFSRRGVIDFPLAMLADTLCFFKPNVEGLAGKLEGDWGYQMAFTDWTGRQTTTVREAFMAGTSGELRKENWFLQNYVLMNHLAHPANMKEVVHIRDHFGFALLTGLRYGQEVTVHGLLKGGLLTSLYRERSVTNGFQTGFGFYLEGNANYRRLGLKTTLYTGDRQEFAHGDPFYRFSKYLRVDGIWYFIQHKNVTGRFNWSMHWTTRSKPDVSQQLTLIYKL